jgi:hypothetical protein
MLTESIHRPIDHGSIKTEKKSPSAAATEIKMT